MLKLPILKELKTIDRTDEAGQAARRGLHAEAESADGEQAGGRRAGVYKFARRVHSPTTTPGTGARGRKGAGEKSSPGFGRRRGGDYHGLPARRGRGVRRGEGGVGRGSVRLRGRRRGGGENSENENGAFALGASGAGGRKRRRGSRDPEDLGASTTEALMAEVQRGGVCDSAHQPLVLLLMAIGPEQLSKVRKADYAARREDAACHQGVLRGTFTSAPSRKAARCSAHRGRRHRNARRAT